MVAAPDITLGLGVRVNNAIVHQEYLDTDPRIGIGPNLTSVTKEFGNVTPKVVFLRDNFGVIWQLHVIGFGVCFCLSLPLACLLQCVRGPGGDAADAGAREGRPRRLCIILLAGSLVACAATLRGFSLLIDPYGTGRVLPARFSRVSGVLMHPTYVTAAYLLQYSLHLATRVNLVLSALHNRLFVGTVVCSHFAVTLAGELAPPRGKIAFALIFLKAFFIFWCYLIDAMLFAFCLKVRGLLDELVAIQVQMNVAPADRVGSPIRIRGQTDQSSSSRKPNTSPSLDASIIRVLHARYFGTCGENAIYTGVDEVDYDNLVVSISDVECCVGFSAKVERPVSSFSTATTSVADRLSQHSAFETAFHQSNAQISSFSPLSSTSQVASPSRNGDLSSYDMAAACGKHQEEVLIDEASEAQVGVSYEQQYTIDSPIAFGSVLTAGSRIGVVTAATHVDIVPTASSIAAATTPVGASLLDRCLACSRALNFGYASALAVFVLCVLQTYAIFGSYSSSIFDQVQLTNMSAWIAYQTTQRLVELVSTLLLICSFSAVNWFDFVRVKRI